MLPFGPDLAELIRLIGYPGLAAIIFAESGLLIGFFLPGASLLFTAGFLASQGLLDIRIIVPLVAIAAILGDNVGYWFGAKVGIHLFDRPDSRFFKREHLERTRRFYAKYGTRTILFARFIPMIRTFAPILAGIAGMPYRPFMIYNILGGILWASGVSFAGYILGETVPGTANYIEFVVLGIIVASCIPLAVEYFRKKRRPELPRAVIFDLDETLAFPQEMPPPEIIEGLHRLAERVPIAIMSGRSFEHLQTRPLPVLPHSFDKSRLYLFPDTGGQGYEWREGAWKQLYHFNLSEEEKEQVMSAVNKAIDETGIAKNMPLHGERFLIKEAQVTASVLGLKVPDEVANGWDPSGGKRRKLKRAFEAAMPEFDATVVGRTSFDITRKGINKAYGVCWFAKHLNIEPKDMLFIGDALYPGGNDYVVIETGIDTRQVQNPKETAALIDRLLTAAEE